jgi:hypothetical protein
VSPTGDAPADLQADGSTIQSASRVSAAIMYKYPNMCCVPLLGGRVTAMVDGYGVINDNGKVCVCVCVNHQNHLCRPYSRWFSFL